jgi:type I restriction enzyme M protein
VLWPHGILFRNEEADIRRKFIESDTIEAVIGLGPNLFYNSPMEACVVVCRMNKPEARRGKIMFINAVAEVTRERAQSFLTAEHIERILAAYRDFENVPGLAQVVTLEEIAAKDGNLSIPLYVGAGEMSGTGEDGNASAPDLGKALEDWLESSRTVRGALQSLFRAEMG